MTNFQINPTDNETFQITLSGVNIGAPVSAKNLGRALHYLNGGGDTQPGALAIKDGDSKGPRAVFL